MTRRKNAKEPDAGSGEAGEPAPAAAAAARRKRKADATSEAAEQPGKRTRGGAAAVAKPAAAAGQARQRSQQPAPPKPAPVHGGRGGRQKAAAATAACSQPVGEEGQTQQQQQQPSTSPAAATQPPPGGAAAQRSPTPMALAPVLEVSRPASPASEAAASAEEEEQAGPSGRLAPGDQDPAYAANTFLMARLRDPRGPEAATAALRPALQAVHDQLVANLESTIELEHNNSMLVLGPRGSGKSLVVESAVAAICAKHNTDPRDPVVGVVRLLGYAHNDDRVAFREIARQLCEEFKYTFSRAASVGENIEFLRELLRQLKSALKVVVFVLDDFDLFARRSKQAVLYNLLDALQTSGMQAAVLGVTCRQDVVELLEKRVKSRFSHRTLNVVLPTKAAPGDAAAGLVAGGLEGRAAVPAGEDDDMLGALRAMLLLPESYPDRKHAERFNRAAEAAVAAPEVAQALAKAMPTCPTLEHLALVVEGVLRASCAAPNRLPTARMLVDAFSQLGLLQRDQVLAVAQLSVLELILLVAMQRLVASGKAEALNFEMAHHEFRSYSARGNHADNYTKGAAAKAFDHLVSQGLVAYADARSEGRAAARQYAPAYLQLRPDELEQGLRQHWNCPPDLAAWLTRQAGVGSTAAAGVTLR